MARKGTCHIRESDCKARYVSHSMLGYVGYCYSCGVDVCTSPGCSKIMPGIYYRERRRICTDCQKTIDRKNQGAGDD